LISRSPELTAYPGGDKLGQGVGVRTLRQALADGDPAAQRWAIRGLGQLGDRESVDLLIAAPKDPHDRIRRAAATSLAKLGDPRALNPVRHAHDESTGFTRRRIGRALRDLASRVRIEQTTDS